ncbi:hypothetical protein LAZ67_19001879 [Cordylochernes scorpioides]|uniref:Uncharacterized protein n=1 Tax=Cordylochernes scorpioides TaxID=51811 RepID=A0ABY6LKM3_9ARAC|nr:hypothetical protein LAZ67_19001879 [Cordylochernes scorpioides]
MIPRCRTVGRSTIAAGLDLSPRRRHTRTRRLSLDKQKRDSSENTTLCHSVIHVDLARHHSKRWRLFGGVNGSLLSGRHECKPLATNRREMVLKCFKDGRKSIADDSRSCRPLTSTTDLNIGQVRDLIVADRKLLLIIYQKYLEFRMVVTKNCMAQTYSPPPLNFSSDLEAQWEERPARRLVSRKLLRLSKLDLRKTPSPDLSPSGIIGDLEQNHALSLEIRFDMDHMLGACFLTLVARTSCSSYCLLSGLRLFNQTLCMFLAAHLPYSLDIPPCDLFFFPKLKMTLKGRRFSSSLKVIKNAMVELYKLRKFDFELAFQQLFSRFKKCIDNQGPHLEKKYV